MEQIEKDKIRQDRINIAMVIGIYITIALLLVAIIVIVKNIQEIKTDPIVYGVDQKGFALCSCYDMNGISYDYNASEQIQKKAGGWNMDLTSTNN